MIFIVDPDRKLRSQVVEQLSRPANLHELEQLKDVEQSLATAGAEGAVVIFGPGIGTTQALNLAARLQVTMPDVSTLLIATNLTSDVLQQALRSGVRDVLPSSFTPKQLAKAVAHAEALSRQMRERVAPSVIDLDEKSDHRVITVLSAKGGVGKSFIATNLAVLLGRQGAEVAMVDLDLQFGDLAIMLQLLPGRTIHDAAQDLDRLDDAALRGYLTPSKRRLALLAAPPEPGLAEGVSSEAILPILRMLKRLFPYVIVDTPSNFDDHVLTAVDESDLVVAVTGMDVPSIKNARLSLQTLELLGVGRERIRTVLNRADSKVGLNLTEVEKALRTKVDVAIPSSRDVALSINRGAPIVDEMPKSAVSHALERLASAIAVSHPAPGKSEDAPRPRFHLGRNR